MMESIIGSAVGAFLGVVAGTAVTIIFYRFQEYRSKKQQIRNLHFELRLNVTKIDSWLTEISRYRNAVNGDSLHAWYGYFDLGKTVSSTVTTMFNSGLLYKILSYEHIEELQQVYWDLSPAGEKYINDQLKDVRDVFNRLRQDKNVVVWSTIAKPEAVRLADFWEDKLSGHRATLDEIADAINET